MTRTLLDVLEEANWIDAAVTLDAIPRADREALEVGLLLAEVARLCAPLSAGASWSVYRSSDGFTALGITPRQENHRVGDGPTLHVALTALLAQLPEARSSADLINDETTRRPAPDVERAEE